MEAHAQEVAMDKEAEDSAKPSIPNNYIAEGYSLITGTPSTRPTYERIASASRRILRNLKMKLGHH